MAVPAIIMMAAPHRTWLNRVMCFLSRLVPRRPELLPGGTFFTYSRKRTLPSGQCYWQEVRIGLREPPDVGVGSELTLWSPIATDCSRSLAASLSGHVSARALPVSRL